MTLRENIQRSQEFLAAELAEISEHAHSSDTFRGIESLARSLRLLQKYERRLSHDDDSATAIPQVTADEESIAIDRSEINDSAAGPINITAKRVRFANSIGDDEVLPEHAGDVWHPARIAYAVSAEQVAITDGGGAWPVVGFVRYASKEGVIVEMPAT